jgi:phenylalanyl-tRNA synthetase beta chain
MKVSLSIVRALAGTEKDIASIGTDELTKLATNRLGGLEGVTEYGRRFDGVVVARVMSCVDHDNSDHLHVCMIDDGGVAKDVGRDKDGYVQVVCGAPNVREGLLVAWIPPGATVPSSLDESEPFVLSKREIRGKLSNGMLASPKELGLFDSHEGILEINPGEKGAESAKPGEPFKNLYGLDDILFDFENKMFTHRPDCFGQIGVGRELAAITGQKFSSPAWYWKIAHFDEAKEHPGLAISNEIDSLVPRIMAVTMKNVKVGESPTWLKAELSRLGSKPVNNVVDISNYVMHLTGQPFQ